MKAGRGVPAGVNHSGKFLPWQHRRKQTEPLSPPPPSACNSLLWGAGPDSPVTNINIRSAASPPQLTDLYIVLSFYVNSTLLKYSVISMQWNVQILSPPGDSANGYTLGPSLTMGIINESCNDITYESCNNIIHLPLSVLCASVTISYFCILF